jgi:hypothetical protein
MQQRWIEFVEEAAAIAAAARGEGWGVENRLPAPITEHGKTSVKYVV